MTRSRYWLPTLLGVAAGLGNYAILHRGTATTALVALRVDKKPGEPLQEADFEPVPVRGAAPLFAGTLTYDDRAAVYGKSLRRKVARGELLLRADVEADPAVVEPPPPGYATLTLPARLSAVACRPAPGEYVELFARPPTGPADAPAGRHGPFRFLGWTTDPSRANHDGQLIHVVVAVPHTAADPREAGLRALQAGGSHDRLVQVEVVRGATKAP